MPAATPLRPARRLTTVLCAAVCLAVIGATLAARPADAYVYNVGVTASPHGRPVPSNFVGIALEFSEIPELAGATPQSVNPIFAALLKSLSPAGRPEVRIGGQSTDRAWWPVRGMARPLGVTYDLSTRWTAAAHAIAQVTGAKYLLGINLEANRTRVSQVEADHLVAGIGAANISALEIGNEPDLYTGIPWYRRQGGHVFPWYSQSGAPVYSRSPDYGPENYVQEVTRTLKVVPRLPIAGPETGSAPWANAFDGLLSAHSQVRVLTSHAYGLNNCVSNPLLPSYPSVAHLVTLKASRGEVSGIGPYVAAAHRNGAAYRIDEMGSVTCNGRFGVSNTLASALWVLDALFTMADDGVDGVNLHTFPNSANGLFDFSTAHGHPRATVRPLYYGALMFAQAAPAGSRLLRVVSRSGGPLRVWATSAPDHHIRVLLVNDSLTSSALAVVRTPVAPGPADVERLRASSASATSGVTLGGRTFGAATTTGVLAAPVAQTVAPHSGAYSVTLPAGSAGLL
ncbi:MAG TPA: glycosyl hydrolase family protein, partial [Solirubrobacteraceae bacterium]|nr:glycosyl hydrolase family protein [Solirubrobacteraceae bacterium]